MYPPSTPPEKCNMPLAAATAAIMIRTARPGSGSRPVALCAASIWTTVA